MNAHPFPAGRAARRKRLPPQAALITPSVAFMAAIFIWPLIVGIGEAFRDSNGFTAAYLRQMTADPYFWPAVRNTILLNVALIPFQLMLALAMALLLRARPRFSQLYFYLWVIPLAISDLAAGLVWLSVFNDRGFLNSVLYHVDLPQYSWLSYQHPATMFLAVLIAELWRTTSLVLVIVVAGMQGIPRDYEEAAEVFGATYLQRIRYVILPQLRPSLQVALILRTIFGFQTFAVAQALTGRAFPLLAGEAYQWYSGVANPHAAAAVAFVLLALSLVVVWAYLRTLRDPKGSRQ